MRLAELSYCRELIDAGVDEFFVSVTASDAESHDAITKVPGSFDKTILGLENLDTFPGVVALTNTVITRSSYRHLPGVVERLGHLKRLVQMDFWNYWPMSETDDKDLLVSHEEVVSLAAAGGALGLGSGGRAVEVKNFPECLLGEERDALENAQPKLLIDPAFWHEFRRNGFQQCMCIVSTCGSSQCLGLNTAYVAKFGWQADLLVPFPMQATPQMATPDRFQLPVIG